MIQRWFCFRCHVLIFFIASFIPVSCNHQPRYDYINPEGLKITIHELDSLVSTHYGYDDQSIQGTYDKARVTWHSFVSKAIRNDFKGAYDVYNQANRKDDFMVFLETSYMRYHFYSEVLRPLFYEYETKEKADSLYIDILELEYFLEAYTIQMETEKRGCVPDEFPIIIQDLGNLQAKNGNIDKSLGLVDDFAYAIYGLSDNGAYTNMMVALLVAGFYNSAGNKETAISTLEDYIKFTKDNMDKERDVEEYEQYMHQARNAIQDLKVLQVTNK